MNTVAIVDRTNALGQTAHSLGIPFSEGENPTINRVLLAQLLRRGVFNAAPCSANALRTLVFAAIAPLADDAEALKARIEDTLQDLIAMGDILEMRADVLERSGIVLRPAPPAFVVRRNGSIILIGISGDEITPDCKAPVVHYHSGLRRIHLSNGLAYHTELRDLGLIELPERLWLYAPTATSAADFAAFWQAQLPAESSPEKIEDFEILDTASHSSFYKGRWTNLNGKHTGTYIARRPQRYGAKLWCLAEVNDGTVQRFTDIRAMDARTRDCDEAWHLQAALDALAGTPQKIGITENEETVIFSFSSPLPAWAARRLSFIGEPTHIRRALLAFKIPKENAREELQWLAEKLWLVHDNEGGFA